MTSSGKPPFERRRTAEGPAIVGAEWWQEGLATAANPVVRRQALIALGVIVGGTAVLGAATVALVAASSGSSDEEVRTSDALETQRDYGWSFGAEDEALPADGANVSAFDRSTLVALGNTGLPPTQPRLRPFYQGTLFEALRATPTKPREGGETSKPLVDAIKPVFTTAMGDSYSRGRGLASLFDGKPPDVALFIDLPGPEAVAFAAGAAGYFDPVLTFDNWPHPRGVVPAHLTLAAIAFYQSAFARFAAARKPTAAPAFVLDRNRLLPYSDEASQFDNRYVAKVPGADQLRALGITHVLYVAPQGSSELDDLNEDFVAYAASGIDVKTLAPSDFGPSLELPLTPPPASPPGSPPSSGTTYDYGNQGGASYYYGGSPASHVWFWHHYAWYASPRPPTVPSPRVSGGYGYRPSTRPTLFRGFVGMQKTKPSDFGRVPVVFSRSRGTAYGPRFGRSGSWGRSGGWSGSS